LPVFYLFNSISLRRAVKNTLFIVTPNTLFGELTLPGNEQPWICSQWHTKKNVVEGGGGEGVEGGEREEGEGGGRNQCCPKEERRNILPDGVWGMSHLGFQHGWFLVHIQQRGTRASLMLLLEWHVSIRIYELISAKYIKMYQKAKGKK